ncbi:TonB-dependent siderophore receptor [Pseudomonas proteolytica]|uniref:TonB-dependent siderophore receptor n=1 Tax=Pseudomonas proteolytica TaxID=219574 RepID=UPI00089AC71C|nr:TonB-dependent siderophore receptor [Pseudomonas proteolytica]KAA8701562.1 TonB-dependent siderophore receptor [Pseudomonas proteolytica]TWR81711.1 TonB-dependent siderophore receptor [Pseudomonas proteolytica]SEE26239.1 outer-membrane receptor for ferric coprogen and ferric-rhodotorulic acid [Pseudomonas proteolytica]
MSSNPSTRGSLLLASRLLLGCLPLALPAFAYAQQQVQAFDIAPGPLSEVLSRYAQAAGAPIAFQSQQVAGLNSAGVRGSYNVEDGFAKVLEGTGFAAQASADGYQLQALPQANGTLALAATEITSNQLGTVTEGTGSYTPGTIATATRMVLTPKETPQSITVITRQHMDDFGLNAIDDVMRHTPGITVSTYDSERTNYFARGFSIENFQYDGIPTLRNSAYSSGQTLTDMAIYDRVEILKGATGLLTGAGAPGATLNLIRKKPTRDFKASIELGAGSWDNYRSQVDVSGPLTDSGNIRGRAVAAYQDKHSFMERYQRKTSVYFGSLEADLDDDTLLTVGFDYQNNDPQSSGWSGSRPLFNTNGDRIDVKRSYNNGAKWSRWEQYNRGAFATLERSFANGWVAKAQVTHQLSGYDAPLGSIQSAPSPDTGLSTVYANKFTGLTRANSAHVYLSGPFSLLGREHELVVGASASNSHWKGKDYGSPTHANGKVVDFWNFDGNFAEPDWGAPTYINDLTTRQSAGYMTSRLSLADPLNLFLGGRVANYKLRGTDDSTETGRLVPYAGVTYDLNENFTAYASYTDIFMPESYNRDRNNKLLEPSEGKNYEGGIKGEFFNGRLNTSLAYFEVHQSHRAEPDAEYNAAPTNPSVGYASKGIEAKTKGFEAEMSGELAPGWQAQAGYTHKIIRDESGKKVSTWEPQDQLSFYTTYKLKGPLDRLTVGGGARWQSRSWQELYNRYKSKNEEFAQEAYWLVDVMARYQVTENLSATLNLNNAFDKKYYTNIGFYNTAYYGDPRNVMLTTRWSF